MTEPSKETEAEILARRQVEALERIAKVLEELTDYIKTDFVDVRVMP
jgi:hypothetical protein